MRTRRAGVLLAAVAVVAVVAVVAGVAAYGIFRDSGHEPKFTAPPAGLPAFYSVPDPLPDVPPGSLLKSEKVDAKDVRGSMYRVMYTSRSARNTPVAVTGAIFVPNGAAPRGGIPVVTWGHGTNGLADLCASSASTTFPAMTNDFLDEGVEVVASDYEGQGTPGILPYLDGVSAARNVIDIVRAARQLPAAHASKEYAVWGYSEGGQTAMFAFDAANAYAPELDLKGVVAGAPPSQLVSLFTHLKAGKFSYYVLMALVGLNAAYGDEAAPLDAVLTPKGKQLVTMIETTCVNLPSFEYRQPTKQLLPYKFRNVQIESTLKADPFAIPAWRKLLTAMDPQSIDTAHRVPLLIIQGGADEQIPAASSRALTKHLCALGQNVERWVYPGGGHAGAFFVSRNDTVHWLSDRFESSRGAGSRQYVPTGVKGVTHTRCPS